MRKRRIGSERSRPHCSYAPKCATIDLVDPQSEKGKIPLYMLPVPAPKSAEEIALCRHIEYLQKGRQFAYRSGEDRVAERLEFEIAVLMDFLKGRQVA